MSTKPGIPSSHMFDSNHFACRNLNCFIDDTETSTLIIIVSVFRVGAIARILTPKLLKDLVFIGHCVKMDPSRWRQGVTANDFTILQSFTEVKFRWRGSISGTSRHYSHRSIV